MFKMQNHYQWKIMLVKKIKYPIIFANINFGLRKIHEKTRGNNKLAA